MGARAAAAVGFLALVTVGSPSTTGTMASIALQQSRMLWPSLTVPFSRPLLAATAFLPSFLPSAIEWRLPSLASVLELFPPFLLAVPKKKTSHSRKAMRSANKGLKDKRSTSCLVPTFALSLTMASRHCSLSWLWLTKARAQYMP